MPEPAIGLYEDAPAACHEYDPRAAEVADLVAGLITVRLPEVAVEHIAQVADGGA